MGKLWCNGMGIIVEFIEGKAGAFTGIDLLLDCKLAIEVDAVGINVSPERNDLGSSLSGRC